MNSYVGYDYYCNDYHGNEIKETDFDRIARKASLFVREITFNRIDEDNISDDVKDAVCAVCEVRQLDESLRMKYKGRTVKSENNDGYSVSFVTEETDGQTHEEVLWSKMHAAARPHLLHTGLLYRG